MQQRRLFEAFARGVYYASSCDRKTAPRGTVARHRNAVTHRGSVVPCESFACERDALSWSSWT